jgi:hypothetical protein
VMELPQHAGDSKFFWYACFEASYQFLVR